MTLGRGEGTLARLISSIDSSKENYQSTVTPLALRSFLASEISCRIGDSVYQHMLFIRKKIMKTW